MGENYKYNKNTDYTSVFPTSKIKLQMKTEKNIGKVFNTAVEKVGAASAMFLENMVHKAMNKKASESKDGAAGADTIVLTKRDLESLLQQDEYQFLDVTIDKKSLPKYKCGQSKRRKKKADETISTSISLSNNDGKLIQKKAASNAGNELMKEAIIDPHAGKSNKNGDGGIGLNLDELVREGEYFDDIIEDDEDYD